MPRLAELQLYEAVGKLSFVGGEYTEPPRAEATDLAVFAEFRQERGPKAPGPVAQRPKADFNFGPARAIGCYLDRSELSGLFVLELFVFDPVVAWSDATISVTVLLSGSINRTRSGSFTNSRFFASGT
jgi:hypothetical protein